MPRSVQELVLQFELQCSNLFEINLFISHSNILCYNITDSLTQSEFALFILTKYASIVICYCALNNHHRNFLWNKYSVTHVLLGKFVWKGYFLTLKVLNLGSKLNIQKSIACKLMNKPFSAIKGRAMLYHNLKISLFK